MRLAASAATLALIVAAGTPAAADRSPSRDGLRAQQAALGARARSALYELYAQDARLAGARSAERRQAERVAVIDGQVGTLSGEVHVARANLAAARGDAARSDRRALQGATALDPVEVLLAASSLQDALSRAQTLQQVASGDRELVQQTLSARDELAGNLRSLQAAQRQAEQEHTTLLQRVRDLAAQRAAKQRLLAGLRRERARCRRRIDHLDARAQAAVARAQALAQAEADAAQSDVQAPPQTGTSPAPVPAPDPGGPSPGATLTVSSTAYCLTGNTATGLPTGPGICATDPSVIPLGTRFYVPGYGECLAADTGSAVIGDTIDLWMPHQRALAWGRRTVTIRFD